MIDFTTLGSIVINTIMIILTYGLQLAIFPVTLLSAVFLITWVIDSSFNKNYSGRLWNFLIGLIPQKDEKPACSCKFGAITGSYCHICGRQLIKEPISIIQKQYKHIEILGICTFIFLCMIIIFKDVTFPIACLLLALSYCFWAICDWLGITSRKPTFTDEK